MKYPVYEHYKDSGVEWLGMIPGAWKPTRLKFITKQIVDGTHFTPDYIDEGVPFLRVTDITKGAINFDKAKRISKEEHNQLILRCKPEKGDLLLSKNGTIGVTYIVDWTTPFSIFVSLCLIKPKKLIQVSYLKYMFLSKEIEEQINAGGKTNTITNLHLDKIKEFFVALPSLPEQQTITTFLDRETTRIDQLITKKQKLIETLREKRIALISHAVTKGLNPNAPMKHSGIEWLGEIPEHWEVKQLKYVVSINDETLAETTDPEYEINYVDIGSIDPNKGIISKEPCVFGEAPSRARRKVDNGDIIVSTVRTYLRAIAPIKEPEKNLIVSTGFAVVRPRKIGSDYLSFLLRGKYFVEEVVARSVGVSYPAINASVLGSIKIPIPPEDEQCGVINWLNSRITTIDEIVEYTDTNIGKLQEFKTALISAAVTGKIKITPEL